jgi:hypothetical protein
MMMMTILIVIVVWVRMMMMTMMMWLLLPLLLLLTMMITISRRRHRVTFCASGRTPRMRLRSSSHIISASEILAPSAFLPRTLERTT